MRRFIQQPNLAGHRLQTFSGTSQLDPLCETLVTPQEQFFVHNHGTVPRIDPAHHRLSVTGEVESPLRLSLVEMRDCFQKVTIITTLKCDQKQCQHHSDGNLAEADRAESSWAETYWAETDWRDSQKQTQQSVGTAIWGGVQLLELLLAAGIDHSTRCLSFTGLDVVETGHRQSRFTVSIPVEAALRPEILIAYEMNGEPLLPEHGAPLRLIVPGQAGVRSVKWLAEIKLRPYLSEDFIRADHWQADGWWEAAIAGSAPAY